MYVSLYSFGQSWSAVLVQHAVPSERSAAVLIPAPRRASQNDRITCCLMIRYSVSIHSVSGIAVHSTCI